MGMLRYFKGYARVKITGAAVENFLNQMTQERIAFWDIERQDELHYIVSVETGSLAKTEKIAIHNFCHAEVLYSVGLMRHLRRLKKRPILLIGMLAAIFASFYFQTCVLAIEVDGNELLHDEEILRALQDLDIEIGSSAGAIDQQLTKHRMLNRLPQLSWIAVNRNGCKLNVLVTERSFAQSTRPSYPSANVVASRDAVVTDVIVSEGMKLCKTGDTVKAGQILVSGFEDYGLILKGVCAEAEIYGQTWYDGMVLTPTEISEKRYTGRQWTQYSLIVGRKRINLCGNSGISGITCDKMVETTKLSVSSYEFPIVLEKVTYREYETETTAVEMSAVKDRMIAAWDELISSQMIAGKILNTQTSCVESGGVYVLSAQSTCHEMIGRYAPMDSVFEGETNDGTNYQRRAN